MRNKLFSAIALTGAAGLLLVFASPSYRQGEPSMAGKSAPDFTFTLGGKPMRLSDLRGKVVVLNFWASWCPPCVEETPALNNLHAQMAPQGVFLLGVSVDDDHAAYEKFLTDHRVLFATWRDPAKKVNAEYGTFMYPETYIVARDGKVARKIIGPQDWTNSEHIGYLQDLLKK